MRPKKRIFLASANEDRLSVLKFVLETNGYAVTAFCESEAIEAAAERIPELVLIDWPFASSTNLIDAAREMWIPSLVTASRQNFRPECLADHVLYCNTPLSELLDRVKVMSARKRGPRPAGKPVASAVAPQIVEQTA